MKKTVILLACLAAMVAINAQNRASDKFFDSIKDREDVAIMSFSKSIIEMLNMNINVDGEESKKVTGVLNEIKVSIFDKVKNSNCESEVITFFKKKPFDEVDLEDNDNSMRVFVNRKGKIISECHLSFQGEKRHVLVSFFGDFNIDDLNDLKKTAKGLNL